MPEVAKILSRIEDLNKPKCDMPPRAGCGQLAEHAYFDHATNEVIYRCNRHRITVFHTDETELLESIDTIEEAIAREVIET
jgi:hypothetical protein